MDDLQRQLDELSVKFKWQAEHENLTIAERISELEKLIEKLSDDEAIPYIHLYESYERFKRWGIDT